MREMKPLKWALRFILMAGLFFSLAGCEGPCDKLLNRVCEEWDDPQKCAEWSAIAEQAGDDSCEESLKMIEERER